MPGGTEKGVPDVGSEECPEVDFLRLLDVLRPRIPPPAEPIPSHVAEKESPSSQKLENGISMSLLTLTALLHRALL